MVSKLSTRTSRAPSQLVARQPRGGAAKRVGAHTATIHFQARLHRPAAGGLVNGRATPARAAWTFLMLPEDASRKLPSRGQTTVDGTLNGCAFTATLEPDGQGGHWLRVERKLRVAAGAEAGDIVALAITPVAREPEPRVPPELRQALAAAPAKAREVWTEITAAARRDFIHWITSAKQAGTRTRRIATACDMLARGKRRPCCFDRSGMYSGSLTCPTAAE